MGNVRFVALAAVVAAVVAGGPSSVALDGQVAAAPILLVLDDASPNPFGAYLGEVLRAEGITAVATTQLSTLTSGTLAEHRLAILAETTLTAGQASMFAAYVSGGGRLIAMRPDAQLFATLGIADAGGTTTDGYLLVDQAGPGAGLQADTLPFKGAAAHYTPLAATPVATLYASASTATAFPAVVMGPRTAAWSFDLARSVAYVRQGDPALAGVERDGEPVYRTNDIFFGAIDLDRMAVPHADVQMRLFSRVIAELLADSTPLPQLWYFPGTARTMLVPTGDSHISDPVRYAELLTAVENAGARITLYLPRWGTVPSAIVDQWRAAGHEVGLHPYFAPDELEGDIAAGYAVATGWWQSAFTFPWSATTRHHALEWSGWVDPVAVMAARGVRMDTSYYAWGPALNHPTQQEQAHGYINGSGLPMRFVTEAGQVLPVYQQSTSLTDEQLVSGYFAQGLSVPQALAVSRRLIDDSQAGGYSAITTQFHVDTYAYGEVGPWVDGTLAYAQSLQLPMWPAQRWLQFVEARAATAVTTVAWSAAGRALTFSAQLPAGAEPLTVLVPGSFGGEAVEAVAIDGQNVAAPTLVVNGRSMRAVTLTRPGNGAPLQVSVFYALVTPALTVGDVTVTEGHAGTTTVQVPVTLSAPSATAVTATYQTADGTATQPADYLAASGTVTFEPFQTSTTIAVSVVGDVAVEGAEAFAVILASPVDAIVADGVGSVAIVDDDTPPVVSVSDATVTEGNSGTAPATFTVTLSHPTGSTVTVPYATANGSAVAPADFASTSGTVTFAPGVTTATIVVAVVGDTAAEPNETFTVNLGGPVNAMLGDGQGVGTIVNDDAGTTTTTATFQVAAAGDDVTEEGASFTADGGTVWVGSGASAATSFAGLRFANVTIPQGAVVQSARVELRSASPQWLTMSFELAVEAAANAAPFSAASRPSQRALLLPRVSHTSNAQWLADTWYQLDEIAAPVQAAVNQTGWTAGNALAVIVRGAGQNWARKFALAFDSDPAFAPRLVVTYASGPSLPTLSVADVAVTEGTGAVVPAAFAVTLSSPSAVPVTVQYAVAGSTASLGADVAAASGTLTFAPGVTAQTVSVDVLGDTLDEPTETFTLTLSAPTNAAVDDASALGTITDDDAPPTASIGDVLVVEGNAGTTPATFTVTLSAASGHSVSLGYAAVSGTAIVGSDFAATSGTLTFAPGATSQTVTVPVMGDTLAEADETFTVALSAPINVTVADGIGQATIDDNDPPPSLGINDVTLAEGQSGTGTAVLTVTLSSPSGQEVTVAFTTADGTAVAPADYTSTAGTLTFPAGTISRTIAVPVAGDTAIENDETFTVTLSSPVNATLGDAGGLVTLVNDDGVPAISVADATVSEGQSGTATLSFLVTLAASTPQTVTVGYATANGTAVAGSDYTAATGTVTFAPGVTSKPVAVAVAGDTLFEASETLTLSLNAPVNATIADGSATGTIANDDAAPTLTIGDATVAEGHSGTTAATFTVTLSAVSGLPASVPYATANGTASAGSDFTAASGTLTIPAGATSATITVTVAGDVVFEPTETFTVVLGAPTNAVVGDGVGQGTITNDDAAPTMAVSDVSVTEGHTGTSTAVFVVTLSGPSSQTVTVQVATADGSATAGSDYAAVSGTVTFAPGVVSQTVPVSVLGDTAVEASETFTLQLSGATNATIADASGVGTIVNDDVPALAITDVTIAEGNAGTSTATFTVTLSAASTQTVTVAFATANGSATAGSDYVATSGTLTFTPGTLNQPVPVTILGDTATESNETFTVTLSTPTNASIADAQGLGTITNDDAGAVTVTTTFQVAAGGDDVNEDTGVLVVDSGSGWVGNGSATASYAGFRFTGVTIPAGATITSARLEVRAASTQWQRMAFELAVEASANSAAFSTASRPSQRALLAPRVTHSSDAQWLADTWYALDQMAPLLQAAIAQPGWSSGNAVSLVLRGTGSAWGRKFVRAFEADPAFAPRLVVTYQLAP